MMQYKHTLLTVSCVT